MNRLVVSISLLAASYGFLRTRSPIAHTASAAEVGAPFVAGLADLAARNQDYRRVIYTGPRTQLVLMSLPPGTDIGRETHRKVEQILFVTSGQGTAILDGKEHRVSAGEVIAVPPGVTHDIVNDGSEPLKLYTVYSPPNHLPDRVQATKADAEADKADQEIERRSE